MMNEFILCSSATGSGYYLAETKPCQYECHSYIAPLSRDYYGNYGASSAQLFPTKEAARRYLEAHRGIIPDNWNIREYNAMMNNVLPESEVTCKQ